MWAAAKELAKLHGKLVERRARLLGEVKAINADPVALACAVTIVDPESEFSRHERRGRPILLKQQVAFGHGELISEMLRILCKARELLNAHGAILVILYAKSLSIKGVRTVSLTTKVSAVMKSLIDAGQVQHLDGGNYVL